MKEFSIEQNNFLYKFISSRIDVEGSLDDLHDFYEIAFFIHANLNIFIEDSKYEIKDGDLFFIPPKMLHHIFYNKTDHYARYVIHFKKDFIDDILKVLNLENLFKDLENSVSKKVSIPLHRRNDFETLFRSMAKADSDFSDQKYKLNLVLILIKSYEEFKKAQPRKKLSKKYVQTMQIIRYIDTNYSNTLSLDSLAQKFSYNKYYLCHAFKEVTGFSIIQYIQYRRVMEAQKLLKQTAKDIMDICYDCGFNNLQNFYKAFKKVSGITPCKFRS